MGKPDSGTEPERKADPALEEDYGHGNRPLPPGWRVQRMMLIGIGIFLLVVILFPLAIWWLSTQREDPRQQAIRVATEPGTAVAPGGSRGAPVAGAGQPALGAPESRKPEWLAHDSPEAVFERLWPMQERGEANAEEQDALIFLAQELRYLGRSRAVLAERLRRTDPRPGRETRVLEARQAFLEGDPVTGDRLFEAIVSQDASAWEDKNVRWLAGQVVERWIQLGEWQRVVDTLKPVGHALQPIFYRQLARAMAETGDRAGVAQLVERQAASFTPLERVRARLVLAALVGNSGAVETQMRAGLSLLREGASADDWAGWFATMGSAPEHLPAAIDAVKRATGVYESEAELMALIGQAARAGTWAAHRAVAETFLGMRPNDPVFRHNALYLDLVAGHKTGHQAVAEARDLVSQHPQPQLQATLLLALLRANLTTEVGPVVERLRAVPGGERAGYRWIVAWGEATRGRSAEARALLEGYNRALLLPEERVLFDRLARNLQAMP